MPQRKDEMTFTTRSGQDIQAGSVGRNQLAIQEAEEAEQVRLAGRRTATRSEGARVVRGTPGASAQRIPQVAPRSGIAVTRPAESKIQTAPNVWQDLTH